MYILKYADKLTAKSDTLPRRTEGRAKHLYESQNPEKLHEGWNEASAKENSLKKKKKNKNPNLPHQESKK